MERGNDPWLARGHTTPGPIPSSPFLTPSSRSITDGSLTVTRHRRGLAALLHLIDVGTCGTREVPSRTDAGDLGVRPLHDHQCLPRPVPSLAVGIHRALHDGRADLSGLGPGDPVTVDAGCGVRERRPACVSVLVLLLVLDVRGTRGSAARRGTIPAVPPARLRRTALRLDLRRRNAETADLLSRGLVTILHHGAR